MLVLCTGIQSHKVGGGRGGRGTGVSSYDMKDFFKHPLKRSAELSVLCESMGLNHTRGTKDIIFLHFERSNAPSLGENGMLKQ